MTKETRLSETKLRFVLIEILQGLKYLHDLGIVHRDIKLENIMITDDGRPKLIDFGLSAVVNVDEKVIEGMGSIAYCSPEIIHHQPYSFPTDIWSLGVVMYTLMTGRFPFLN